jgi:hypothetical protein
MMKINKLHAFTKKIPRIHNKDSGADVIRNRVPDARFVSPALHTAYAEGGWRDERIR